MTEKEKREFDAYCIVQCIKQGSDLKEALQGPPEEKEEEEKKEKEEKKPSVSYREWSRGYLYL